MPSHVWLLPSLRVKFVLIKLSRIINFQVATVNLQYYILGSLSILGCGLHLYDVQCYMHKFVRGPFPYVYSLACLSVVRSLGEWAEILVKGGRH